MYNIASPASVAPYIGAVHKRRYPKSGVVGQQKYHTQALGRGGGFFKSITWGGGRGRKLAKN